MKKAKIIAAIVCAAITIGVGIAASIVWSRGGCNGWGIFAGWIFYAAGGYGLYTLASQAIDAYNYWYGDEYYKGGKK